MQECTLDVDLLLSCMVGDAGYYRPILNHLDFHFPLPFLGTPAEESSRRQDSRVIASHCAVTARVHALVCCVQRRCTYTNEWKNGESLQVTDSARVAELSQP